MIKSYVSPTRLADKSEHGFTATLRLKPGGYRLKFIVDDSWRCSKDIPTATDEDGTLVNWLEVEAPQTEAEAKSAWEMDPLIRPQGT
jgi:5'-AMP-activated protein kinase regulatory beta subunit